MNQKADRMIFPLVAILCLTPWVSSAVALLLGVGLAVTIGNPYLTFTKKWAPKLLPIAVVGLGAGMNLHVIGQVGVSGIGYTVVGILMTVLLGITLGRILKTEKDTSLLITVGTAICGGSAIAAVAPVIRAKNHEVSIALGTVFMLNAAALFLFPFIGHQLALTETQFGLWSALAIHDTSSVVGATLQYGAHALEVGTTVKLARALWIVPVAVAIGFLRQRSSPQTVTTEKAKRPWFIIGFLIAAAIVTFIPTLQPAGHAVEKAAKQLMVLTLFLIGSNLNRETIKAVGARPFIQGIALWIIVASLSLAAIYYGYIS